MKKADLKKSTNKPISMKKILIILLLVCFSVFIAISVIRFDKRMERYAERDRKAKAQLTVEAKAELPVIENALAVYYLANKVYPGDLSDLGLANETVNSRMYEGLETMYSYTAKSASTSKPFERYCSYHLGAGILVPSWEGQDYYETTSVSKDNC